MDKKYADNLRAMLQKAAPVRTGQLRDSIQEALPYQGNGWVITIGNGTTQTQRTPSNVYASITNNSKFLQIAIGKRSEKKKKMISNKNYHWATDTIQQWCKTYSKDFVANIKEDEADE